MTKQRLVSILKKIKIYFAIDFLRKIRFFRYRFHHPYFKLQYSSAFVTQNTTRQSKDEEFFLHVKAISDSVEFNTTSQWKDIFSTYHLDIVGHLKNKDFNEVQKMLSDPLSNDLMYGFDNLARSLRSKLRLETRSENSMTADHFLALAEFSGVTKYFGPEALVSPRKSIISINPLIEETVKKLFGKDITFPNLYPGESGLDTPFGIASLRVPSAIYQACQATKYGSNVCEIGPGLGRTAYFANLLGAQKYTLVDIPITSLCQGHFLLNSLPDVDFSVSGQSDISQGIQLRLPPEFFASSEKYDVVINCDSLTEIGIDYAREYLNEIISRTKYFLSINHEGNEFTIRELALEFKELNLISRTRSWVRPGYVEEFYEIKN